MKKTIGYILIAALLMTGTLFWGCSGHSPSPVYTKEGKTYGKVQGAFRHRWWNYYERGLSYADGRFYEEAIRDFKACIEKRDKDQRMARTYGMHFMDYFPNRELGIIYYKEGNLETARDALESSLKQFPTAKARFYLDRVRRDLIIKGERVFMSPKLTLDFRGDEVWTREDPIIISGLAEDEHYVSGLKIKGVPVYLESAEKRLAFEEALVLEQGQHTIEIEAKNLPGKVTKRRLTIHVDREGPMITVDTLYTKDLGSRREITIQGSIDDEAGVSHFSINGETVLLKGGEEASFAKKLITSKAHLEMVAQDKLGNRTSFTIDLNRTTAGYEPVKLAFAGSDLKGLSLAGLFGAKDKKPPQILLKGWTGTQTVFLEKIYLEGQVSDDTKVKSLEINDIPVLRRKGQRVIFSHLAQLQEGENVIVIQAEDESGNVASNKILVIRRIPKALQLGQRLSLTVLPFEKKGAVSEASLFVQDSLTHGLVTQNRFQVIERERLDLILQEQKLSQSKLIDRNTALRLGRLVAAQAVITGSIIETSDGIEVVVRMIDTETSGILTSVDVYGESKDLPAIRTLTEGLATKIHREFPLIGGVVLQQKGNAIFTDLGQNKTKIDRKLIIYHEEEIKHPLTGKVLGADNQILGRARVVQVMPEMSKAEILTSNSGSIKRLDKVITE